MSRHASARCSNRVEKGDPLMPNHWFWGALTIACVIWYSTITIYVAFKGARDIKNMLARLDTIRERDAEKS